MATDAPRSLPAGRVGRPHGLDGSFYVTNPRPGLLTLGAAITVSGRTARVVRRAGTDLHPIVRLEGVEDRDGAEALRGLELSIPHSSAPALAEGEWWAHELEGCEVVCGERLVGTVSRLIGLPTCEALEVQRAAGRGVLIVPMVKDAVRRVEAGRRIEVDLQFLGEDASAVGPEGDEGPGERRGD